MTATKTNKAPPSATSPSARDARFPALPEQRTKSAGRAANPGHVQQQAPLHEQQGNVPIDEGGVGGAFLIFIVMKMLGK